MCMCSRLSVGPIKVIYDLVEMSSSRNVQLLDMSARLYLLLVPIAYRYV